VRTGIPLLVATRRGLVPTGSLNWLSLFHKFGQGRHRPSTSYRRSCDVVSSRSRIFPRRHRARLRVSSDAARRVCGFAPRPNWPAPLVLGNTPSSACRRARCFGSRGWSTDWVGRVPRGVEGFSVDDSRWLATGHTAQREKVRCCGGGCPNFTPLPTTTPHLTLHGLPLLFDTQPDSQRGTLKTAPYRWGRATLTASAQARCSHAGFDLLSCTVREVPREEEPSRPSRSQFRIRRDKRARLLA